VLLDITPPGAAAPAIKGGHWSRPGYVLPGFIR